MARRPNWWGPGPAPTTRWPGVTIPLDTMGGRYRFDASRAQDVCEWFPAVCSHSKGEWVGQRFDLLPYQTDLILRPIFGWLHAQGPQEGRRRFRKAYIQIPKKNGKTQLIAGLALYMLLADGESGAEVYVAAADRDQARILFKAAHAMVEANHELAGCLVCYRNEIVRRDDPTAFFRVLSAEAASKHGPNIHCLIMDELHAQPDRDLFETLTRGTIARRQPLTLLITTAGDDDESICYEEYDYARRLLHGTITDESHLPVIFEAAPEDDWQSPAIWRKVNPAIDVTISEPALAEFARAAANEPRKLNDFLRFHLNRWVGQAEAWIPLDWWDGCRDPVPDETALLPLAVAGGLDLAQKYDLAAFVLAFRVPIPERLTAEVIGTDAETGQTVTKSLDLNYRIVLRPWFWLPWDTLREAEQRDGIPYSDWVRQGLLTVTEGTTIDYTRIYRDITERIVPLFPRLKQSTIGYDPAFATDLATQLRDRAGLLTAEVPQNYQHFSEACMVFEALVKAGRVAHGGHRILRNHVECVAVRQDPAGRIRPVRPKRRSAHIDGVVASMMAIKQLALVPDTPTKKFSLHFLREPVPAGGAR